MSDLLAEVRDALALPPPAVARAIREAADVTQERMAAELGVHRVTVARWEQDGGRSPRGELRARYARLLRELQGVIAS
ncbi:MAG: helix-turn-helix transcriptional regulator [Acidimicrobiales bacterium]